MAFPVSFERLFDGRPLISPRDNWWESGVTFNSAAVHLPPTQENLPAIRALLGADEEPREIVALHYRARPKEDEGFPWTRSFVGVSVHEPDLTPIRRLETPVLAPGEDLHAIDSLGVEDPRVTWIDGAWWMAYCGVMPLRSEDPNEKWRGSVCLAKSYDLVNWEKVGAAEGTGRAFGSLGTVAEASNKDGVILPDRIDGKVVMLHRPMAGPMHTWTTSIAVADAPDGPYIDLGGVHGAMFSEDYLSSWVGAGCVPIKIGEGRYLSIEHTGNYLEGQRRKYVLDAFLYDFNDWDPTNPETLVAARMDDIMRPETDFEVFGPFPDSVANVVFACGSYVYDGWLYVVYGGGDSYILAARTRFDELVAALESRVADREPALAGAL
jgi:predicted GH43/DUF377 family glycosyl hydrolase